MAQLINEAKRFQKLAGILNEEKYLSLPYGANLRTHGRIDVSVMLKDEEIDKFIEKLKSPNNPKPEVYVDRDGRVNSADGNYYEYTTIVDKLPPNAGGKSGEEMKKIADSLGFKGVRGSDMKESPNMNMSNTALDYSNTSPNTPPGATAGEKPNQAGNMKESIEKIVNEALRKFRKNK
jgi:hypothetical protein